MASLEFPGVRLDAHLGEGGFGVVYRAYDEQRREYVALKTLRNIDGDALYRFKREFRSLCDLRHPNLVSLYQLREAEGRWFFTMELVDGVDLISWVRPEGRRDERRLRGAFSQVAAGLAVLHGSGRLHRDLKPANVMVTRQGQVKLLDFGLVHEVSRLDSDRSTACSAGTPAYMAPEQARDVEPTPAADWYSVGAMLYEALTGRLPFEGSPIRVLVEKQRNEPADPVTLDSSAPPDLCLLAVGLLRRLPEARTPPPEALAALETPASAAPRPAASGDDELFVGREAERAVLDEALCRVEAGRRVVIHVIADSGVGKSALLRRFASDLVASARAVVVRARCHERESVPFKAVDGLIDALSRYLRRQPPERLDALLPPDVHALLRLFPVLGRVERVARAPTNLTQADDPHERQRRGFAALRALLGRVAALRPLVLVLDDLQWGDADSAELLRAVLGAPDPPPVLLVCAYRDSGTGGSPFLQHLRRCLPHRDLRLGPLDTKNGAALAAALLGEADVGLGAALAAEARGNPFFIAQLARYVVAEGRLALAAGELRLQGLIRGRIEALAVMPRALLDVVALAAGPVALHVALAAAGLGADASALAALEVAGLVRQRIGEGGAVELEAGHDQIREAGVVLLDAVHAQAVHQRLADALTAAGGASREQIAAHLAGAGRREAAAAVLLVAAEHADQQLAFERAAELIRRARELGAERDATGERLAVRLAEALGRAGRAAEAGAAFIAAADTSEGEADGLIRAAADHYLRGGYLEEGLAAWRRVLEPLRLSLPRSDWRALLSVMWRRLRVRLRGLRFVRREPEQIDPALLRRLDATWEVSRGIGMIDPIRSADFQSRCLLLALRAGDSLRVARSLAVEAVLRGVSGPAGQRAAHRLLSTARGLVDHRPDAYSRALLDLATSMVAYHEGDWRRSGELAQAAHDAFLALDAGLKWEVQIGALYALISRSRGGDIEHELTEAPRRAAVARARGDRLAMSHFILGAAVFPSLGRDDPDAAAGEIESAFAPWQHTKGSLQYAYGFRARVALAAYRRDARAAMGHVAEMWAAVSRAPSVRRLPYMRVICADALAKAGLLACSESVEAVRGEVYARKAVKLLRRTKLAWGHAIARLIDAQLALAAGHREAARDGFRHAAEAFARAGMAHYERVARVRHARLAGDEAAVNAAHAWLRDRGVVRPEALVDMLAPVRP